MEQEIQEIERYRKPTRILHWVHAGCFVVMFITGLFLFVPPLGFLAEDSWSRLLHRIAVGILTISTLVYIVTNWRASLGGIKEAFTWGKEDLGWIRAAPRYYFLCDEEAMPPQEHMNTGQKLWWLMVIVFGIVMGVSGIIMWAFKTIASAEVLRWAVFAHDIGFVVLSPMFFVHIYLSLIHPLMRPLGRAEPWHAMVHGKVAVEYARTHHTKWYEKVKGKEVGKEMPGEQR